MKLKGLTKLALSGVALAAVAATLGTSTYAWYVTNSRATVQGVQGASKAIGEGTILVAQNIVAPEISDKEDPNYDADAWELYNNAHGHTDFGADVTITSDNLHAAADGLIPVTPRGEGVEVANPVKAKLYTYYERTGTAAPYTYTKTTDTDVAEGKKYYTLPAADAINANTKWYSVDGDVENTNHYIQFDLWLYSSEDVSVRLNYAFENSTATDDLDSQIAYAADAPVNMGQTFTKNIKDALRLAYTTTDYVNNSSITYTYRALANEATYDGNVVYYTAKQANPTLTNPDHFEKATVDETTFADLKATLYTRSSSQVNNWTETPDDTVFVDVAAAAKKSTYVADIDFATGGDANAYYKNVLGKDPIFAEELTGSALSADADKITLVGGHEYKLSIYVWLEGTDTDCFDSVNGQDFNFKFTFEA